MTAVAIILRLYQTMCIDWLRRAFAAGHHAVLFVLATGAGKTIIFCAIIVSATSKGNRTLVLVHRHELIYQTCARLDAVGVQYGVIAATFDENTDALVQVASVQTIINRLDMVGKFDLIIIDEAHHAVAETYKKIIDAQRKRVTRLRQRQQYKETAWYETTRGESSYRPNGADYIYGRLYVGQGSRPPI
jgi:DNA repair protein RadD